ncbi:uncharacterized protein J8A68_005741 [[Candida] subhashii]|uniref:Uncharacterized protein n=1 Tax=[Candida] subhashii TaxID=561895 RepID=A0A8J5Q263_9ASCO|nr:uncharacterized protein J8A68_005741 [[Candida] subhashii]KAG7660779.1 hypothetical protein J8A68_005741 [[Candida] subhashii]
MLFNPKIDGDLDVHLENWSLVKSTIEHYYLFNMNERLDFELLEKKFEYYNTRWVDYRLKYARIIAEDEGANMIQRNLTEVMGTIWEYKGHEYALLDTFLYNKLATGPILKKLVWDKVISKYTIEAQWECTSSIYSYRVIQLRTIQEINFHKIRRLQIIRFKFDELQYYFTRLEIGLSTGQFEPIPDVHQGDYIDIILRSRNQSTTTRGDNPELPVYDDEESPIQGFEDFSFKDSFYVPYSFLKVRYNFPKPSESKLVWTVSPALVKRDLDLAFETIPKDYVRDPDPIISAVLEWFHPDAIRVYTPKQKFREYVSVILKNSVDGETSESLTSLYEAFDLYDVYSKQDCQTIESRRFVAFMLEDLKLGMVILTKAYMETLNFAKMWKYLRDLNNTDLISRLIVSHVPMDSLYDEL